MAVAAVTAGSIGLQVQSSLSGSVAAAARPTAKDPRQRGRFMYRADRRGILAGVGRGWRVHQRRRRVLRISRRDQAGQADWGHGAERRWSRVLAGGLRWRHLLLRGRHLLKARPGRCTSTSRSWAWCPRRMVRGIGWWPPMAASSPSEMPGSTGRWAVSLSRADRRHGGNEGWARLLARRGRRRCIRVR